MHSYGDTLARFIYRRVDENLEDAQEIAIDTMKRYGDSTAL